MDQRRNDSVAIPDDTIPRITLPDSTIQVTEDKIDTNSKVLILDNGDTFSQQDKIGPQQAKLTWKGIFYNKGKYFIKPVKIKFVRAHTEFDQKLDQKTGWELKCLSQDSCTNVISGVNLADGPVKKIKFNDFYSAGQKFEFDYEDVHYILYTTGTKRNGKTYNFKIFLTANVKGHVFNQLIRSLQSDIALNGGSDDVNVLFISFIGDLDGDKIPDFIIGDGGYAYGSTSLYMSKPAGDKAILKLVCHFGQSD
jgi:hypothetical protein